MRSQIIFISNSSIIKPEGGWDGLGSRIHDILCSKYDVELIENISPKVYFVEKFISNSLALIGLKSYFYFFSRKRLKKISDICKSKINNPSTILFFHGSTPWIEFLTDHKYFVLLDCNFNTYINVYHKNHKFLRSDIKRIADAEKLFLKKAEAIFFTSNFALNETLENYCISPDKLFIIGQGSSVNIDDIKLDLVIKKRQFLFIASDFIGKGGLVVYKGFCKFHNSHPDFKLVIVGQKPPMKILEDHRVLYLGFIDKSSSHGLNILLNLYRESYFLLLFSTKDIAPFVIVEAGICYCPTLALNFSAIGDMIIDKKSGYLVEAHQANLFWAKLCEIADLSKEQYDDMCLNAHNHMKYNFNWELTKNRIAKVLDSYL